MQRRYAWLGLSIVLEVMGASLMKTSNGFTNLSASIMVIVCYFLALVLYILLTKNHGLGLMNALWSGGGTLLITVIGILFLGESISIHKWIGVILILTGIVGLNVNHLDLEYNRRRFSS
ncbi:multidrug efflux SMR transporter [Halobacillus salinarum]|uniref:Multidrug efflux SMR transporter n=1 Tax=Halobacillus salinarum TaxID=2932257 RepID=A0ABY4EJD6_9BACI|nr:multidrug efflux SMR transporter [Halobacillus salinarum]UOQ44206.1 multidrug efflux SMR transporter [Halobacillus salinarum]